MGNIGQNQIISFLKLRAAIGILGILFPVALIVSGNIFSPCSEIQDSLSGYYFTNARDWFVGLLFLIGTLLITYKGYDKFDSILATTSGLSAIGIALFPTAHGSVINDCNLATPYSFPLIHYIFAGIFFISLIIFSLIVFRKTSKTKPPTPQKLIRNRIYLICGWIMIISLVLLAANKFISSDISKFLGINQAFTFVMEWIHLCAFGVSWIIKGEVFLKDEI